MHAEIRVGHPVARLVHAEHRGIFGKERARQEAVEGWTPEHDDEHDLFELARAGACYALLASGYKPDHETIRKLWPFEEEWLKPSATRRRDLVKGTALLLADIERLDRAEAQNDGYY